MKAADRRELNFNEAAAFPLRKALMFALPNPQVSVTSMRPQRFRCGRDFAVPALRIAADKLLQ